MKSLNVVVGAGFAFVGLVTLLLGDGLMATVMGLFSASVFLSDLSYTPAGVAPGTPVPLSPTRKTFSIGLAVVAMGLLGYEISSQAGTGRAHAGLPVIRPHWDTRPEAPTGFYSRLGIRVETRYLASPW